MARCLPAVSAGQRDIANVLYKQAKCEKMTLHDLYNLTAAARGHWVVCGTLWGIADTLEEWFTTGVADGFNFLAANFLGAFDDFVDLVVPELQYRGLFRRDYQSRTLRDQVRLLRIEARLRFHK